MSNVGTTAPSYRADRRFSRSSVGTRGARDRLVLLARLAVCAYAGWSVGAIVVEALDVILAAPG